MTDRLDRATLLKILDTLDEAQKRWFVGREALRLGHGGIKRACQLSGLSKPTVIKAMRELRTQKVLRRGDQVRRPGGGRKRIEEQDPKALSLLRAMMEQSTAGDPMSLLRWSSKSTHQLADELTRLGHGLSADTVARRLKEMDYSLQANVKEKEGPAPPGRDEQFGYIHRLAKEHTAAGQPVISVDTKKKERIGAFKNGGRKWHRKGKAPAVNVHDFPSLAEGTAIPYGACDAQKNEGLVNVGTSHDTPEFAVESIGQWWKRMGRSQYPKADRLLICADGGGSNGSRNRAWKYYLQDLSNRTGLGLTVCHYPPGTSKWNKIEHRMFSFISLNWRGEPLLSFETVINLISATKTRAGLKVRARLDSREDETGIDISDEQMEGLNLTKHAQNPQWNYSISPQRKSGKR